MELQQQAASRSVRADAARHARLILLLADGLTWAEIRAKLDCSDSYISRWSKRFASDRLAGLFARHAGRERYKVTDRLEARVLARTTKHKPADGSTHWVMDGPLGKSVEWDADTTMFEPQKRIAWSSREGASIKTSGQVTFAEMGTGQTQVNLTIQWVVPATKGGETLAGLLADPGKRVEKDLYNFKTYVEGRKATV